MALCSSQCKACESKWKGQKAGRGSNQPEADLCKPNPIFLQVRKRYLSVGWRVGPGKATLLSIFVVHKFWSHQQQYQYVVTWEKTPSAHCKLLIVSLHYHSTWFPAAILACRRESPLSFHLSRLDQLPGARDGASDGSAFSWGYPQRCVWRFRCWHPQHPGCTRSHLPVLAERSSWWQFLSSLNWS